MWAEPLHHQTYAECGYTSHSVTSHAWERLLSEWCFHGDRVVPFDLTDLRRAQVVRGAEGTPIFCVKRNSEWKMDGLGRWRQEGRGDDCVEKGKMLIFECDVLTAGLYSLVFVLLLCKAERLRVIPTRGDAYRRGYLLGKISDLLC